MTIGSVFELALHEWNVDPIYIRDNWTGELLNLMTEKFKERKRMEADASSGKQAPLSFQDFMGQTGMKIQKI